MSTEEPSWQLRRRAIYADVIERRRDEREAVGDATLQEAAIADHEVRFASDAAREQALAEGVFAVAIPEGLRSMVGTAGDAFAAGFYRGAEHAPYGRFRELRSAQLGDPLLGFHERTNQIEQLLLERRCWAEHYPAEIAALGEALTQLSAILLRAVLRWSEIPEASWAVATGGCSERAGSYHLTFNHYRPSFPGIGLSSHKDDGFLTILRTTAPGLEVNRHGRWERVRCRPGTFIVNFGLSMEILTRHLPRPIAAIMHRVAHQSFDRTSFGHFTSSACRPGASAGIYTYRHARGLERVCTSRELIDANDEEIYLGTMIAGEDE